MCGIAGVFSTVGDLASFLRYMLDPATATGRPSFGTGWTEESLTIQTGTLEPGRGLFWHPTPGTDRADHTWVHYGFTGTAMWISPKLGTWAVLLTNKVYYTRDREQLTSIRDWPATTPAATQCEPRSSGAMWVWLELWHARLREVSEQGRTVLPRCRTPCSCTRLGGLRGSVGDEEERL